MKLLFALMILSHSALMAQDRLDYYLWPYNDKTNKIEFAGSVRMQGADGDKLFRKAGQYVRERFDSSGLEIQSEDTSTNVLICQAHLHTPVKELGARGDGYLSFQLYIRCRLNGFAYGITNLVHEGMEPDGISGGALEQETSSAGKFFPKRYWTDYKARCYFSIENFIEDLKDYLQDKHDGN